MFIIIYTYITLKTIRINIYCLVPDFHISNTHRLRRRPAALANRAVDSMVMIISFYYRSHRGRGIVIIAIAIYNMQMIFYL